MTRTKVIVGESLPGLNKNIWWYPHSDLVLNGLSGALRMITAKGPIAKLKGVAQLARLYLKRLKE
jgi:hypothetical protein